MANWLVLGAKNILKCVNVVLIIEIELNRGKLAVKNGKANPCTLP